MILGGHYDKKLKASVYPWMDRARMLVGFVYEFEDGTVKVFYWTIEEGSLTFKMHVTETVYIDDPAFYAGRKMRSVPDPDRDEVVNIFDFGPA